MKKLMTVCSIAFVALFSGLNLHAADKPETPPAKAEKKGSKHIPFHGKADAVDKTAKTIKVGERTFHITSTTKLIKAGKPAILADLAVGDEVAGAYHEGEGGKLELLSLRIGPKQKGSKN